MSTPFKTWREAHEYAQRRANKLRVSYGIEKPTAFDPFWTVKMLPRPENRYGWELRCEAVEPMDTFTEGALTWNCKTCMDTGWRQGKPSSMHDNLCPDCDGRT